MARTEKAGKAKMNGQATFRLLVVLFQTPPSGSETLRSLAQQEDSSFSLLVWDNSASPCDERERDGLQKAFTQVEYRHCPSNAPLARVYECVIRENVGPPVSCDYLVIFDQDSTVLPSFISSLRTAATKHPEVGLLLPLVTSADTLVSPATIRWFLGSRWKTPQTGLLPSKSLTAINSGMAISTEYLSKHFDGYPRELTFYGTDNWMCQSYAAHRPTVVVMPTTVQHGLAEHQKEALDKKLWRHREIVRSTRFLNREGLLRRLACDAYLLIFSARKASKFRDGRFLRWI
jgi:hypothetical protein